MFGSDSCDSLNGSYQLPFVDLTAFFFGHQHFGGFRLNVRNHWFGELSFCQFQEWANEEKKTQRNGMMFHCNWHSLGDRTIWWKMSTSETLGTCEMPTSSDNLGLNDIRIVTTVHSKHTLSTHTHTHITFVWHNFFPRRLEAYVYLNFGTFSIQHRNGFVLKCVRGEKINYDAI